MTRSRIVVIGLLTLAAAGFAVPYLLESYIVSPSIVLSGVVLVSSSDIDKQAAIRNVRVLAEEGMAAHDASSNATGAFQLTLEKQYRERRPIILEFRHPDYMPLDMTVLASDRLIVAHLIPLEDSSPASATLPQIAVSNVTIRYAVKTTTLLNAGSVVKTFHVLNAGNVPCSGRYPCSPDGKWKATIGSASLEAPRGDVFSNARVSCIAGPCPFTRISSDAFSQGGPTLHVAILNWSDTTTYLFEAEVFRLTISGGARVSYPVIFGPTLHFTIPAGAEGVYIEADINHDSIVFPLGPEPRLSWTACTTSVNPDHTLVYQCELKPGYTFK